MGQVLNSDWNAAHYNNTLTSRHFQVAAPLWFYTHDIIWQTLKRNVKETEHLSYLFIWHSAQPPAGWQTTEHMPGSVTPVWQLVCGLGVLLRHSLDGVEPDQREKSNTLCNSLYITLKVHFKCTVLVLCNWTWTHLYQMRRRPRSLPCSSNSPWMRQ